MRRGREEMEGGEKGRERGREGGKGGLWGREEKRRRIAEMEKCLKE